jgi:hypothetical protein
VETWRQQLHTVRAQRSRPGLDDKVLLEWNAMMLSSLCEVAAAFEDEQFTTAAVKNARFLVDNLRDESGAWKRSWQSNAEPRARHTALAHDLAHVVDAMVRMYELTAHHEWLTVARSTAQQLCDEFWDTENSGFFTVGTTAEQLIVRQKDLMDNATPSANSVAAMAFLRLSALTGEPQWRTFAIDTLRLLARVAPSAPSAFCHAVSASLVLADGTMEVVLPGPAGEFLHEFRQQWRPHSVVAWGEPFDSPVWTDRVPGSAYVCRDHQCMLPATTVDQFRQSLATNGRDE